MSYDHTIPYDDLNYEKHVISELVGLREDRITLTLTTLTPDDFVEYRKEFEVIYNAWQKGEKISLAFRNAGYNLADYFSDEYLVNPQYKKVLREIKKNGDKRQVEQILINTLENLNDTDLAVTLPELQQQLLTLSIDQEPENAGIDSIIAEFEADRALYEEKRANGEELIGLSTGFKKLDEIIDGLRKGHFWILGGYTNTGKTFAALNIAANLAKNKKRTVLFSLEMTRTDILSRLVGVLSAQNANQVKKGIDDRANTEKALQTLSESNFSCYSGNNDKDIATIINTIHAECIKNKPDLVVVDFVQLIQVKNARSEYETMTSAALALQTAAQKFDVPIIALSQVSNEAAKNDNQQVMGFKGSGGLAAAADLAIELVSGEDSTADLLKKLKEGNPVNMNWRVKKNRHGRIGTIEMTFTGITGQFKDAYDF